MGLIIGPGGKLLVGPAGKLATDTDCCCDGGPCTNCDDDICIEAVFSGWTGGAFACTFINNECIAGNSGECTWSALFGSQACSISQLDVSCIEHAGGSLSCFGTVPAGNYWFIFASPNGGTDTFFGIAPVLAGETYPGSLGGGARTCTFVCDDAGCGDGTITLEGVACI